MADSKHRQTHTAKGVCVGGFPFTHKLQHTNYTSSMTLAAGSAP